MICNKKLKKSVLFVGISDCQVMLAILSAGFLDYINLGMPRNLSLQVQTYLLMFLLPWWGVCNIRRWRRYRRTSAVGIDPDPVSAAGSVAVVSN